MASSTTVSTAITRSGCGLAGEEGSMTGMASVNEHHRRIVVGVPTEIKPDEYRVALTPSGVRELTQAGHRVLVQSGAGAGSAIADDDYAAQGAEIVPDAAAVF